MSKFNRATATIAGPLGVITTEQVPSGKTGNGADGYAYDAKSELFLLATTNMVGENTFYEAANERDARFRDLVAKVTAADAHWTAQFIRWLRDGANMRSASLVAGIEAARTLAGLGDTLKAILRNNHGVTPRSMANSVLLRADEPGEAVAYWHALYGRKLPIWFTRALGDAAARLYTAYNYAKWDSDRKAVRFADVIELSNTSPSKADNTGLFTHILDARPGRSRAPKQPDHQAHPMLAARAKLMGVPVGNRRKLIEHDAFADLAREAGMTWEAISGWVQSEMDATVWERCIPLMGYGALIKNLANFDRAGISRNARDSVASRLSDPVQVAKSRLLPMAFLNAYNNVPSDFWKAVLDDAATAALGNIPTFTGKTLVLIDTSGSMNSPFTTHQGRRRPDAEHLMRWDVAALFGIAFARRCTEATVVSFSDGGWGGSGWGWRSTQNGGNLRFDLTKGKNLLSEVAAFRKTHFIGGGTDTAGAVRQWHTGHERIVLLTDEQANRTMGSGGVLAPVRESVPVYTFNLAGYRYGHAPTGRNRHLIGGLSDAGFRMIHALDAYGEGAWPWTASQG